MTEEQKAPEAAQPAPGAPLPKDIEDGRTFAILSYALALVFLPFFLVPLIMRNNEFALYHAKQCLIICLGGMAVFVLCIPLFCISFILAPAGVIFVFVLDIMGLMNAVKGVQAPVPLIGKYADDWFKGITKV